MKKIFSIMFAVFLLSVTSAFAADAVAKLPVFDVTFNGTEIENENRQFPLLVYKDITYVPMTYYDCRYLGLTTDWNNETRTLSVEKGYVTCAYRDYKWQWENPKANQVTVCDFNIVVNGKIINNSKEEYPLLTFRDVTYFPLTWRFAVEEFGWEYYFDVENGLCINSDNYHCETLYLPNISGNAATDGKYYYYNGTSNGENVIYRVSVADTSNPQVIHKLPNSGMGQRANFIEFNGDVYIKYFSGSSPVMSTEYNYKIEADGSLTSQKPGNYSGGKHGYSETSAENEGITVKFVNEHIQSASKISYTVDGVEKQAEPLPGIVEIGRRRDGKQDYNSADYECIQIYKGKIYFTGFDAGTGTDSALYCIDTATGKTEKLIDGVWGFHVYNGWLNEENADSTMIIYDSNGYLMRYSELNKDIRQIESRGAEEGLILEDAVGDYMICTVQKTIGGDRTVVKDFACYAAGNGSINGRKLMDTTVGTYVKKFSDKICVYQSGEAAGEEIRLLVSDGDMRFYSSDVVNDVFVYEDILLYRIGENTIVRVNMKK